MSLSCGLKRGYRRRSRGPVRALVPRKRHERMKPSNLPSLKHDTRGEDHESEPGNQTLTISVGFESWYTQSELSSLPRQEQGNGDPLYMGDAHLVVLLPLLDKSPPVRPVVIVRPSLMLFPGAPRLQETQKPTANGSSVAGAVGAWRAYSTTRSCNSMDAPALGTKVFRFLIFLKSSGGRELAHHTWAVRQVGRASTTRAPVTVLPLHARNRSRAMVEVQPVIFNPPQTPAPRPLTP